MGGNESKQNYLLDIEANKWSKAGILPDFHIVTEQVNFQYNNQTVTVFTQVNFQKNQFEICMAHNAGVTDVADHQWTWLFKEPMDIQNFHMKSAFMIEDKLVLTCRGKPRNTFEQCCSFLLILQAEFEGQMIKGFNKEYTFIKLDPIVYPQLITQPEVQMGNGKGYYAMITVAQENNFQDSFPRQLLRIILPNEECLSKDCSFIDT